MKKGRKVCNLPFDGDESAFESRQCGVTEKRGRPVLHKHSTLKRSRGRMHEAQVRGCSGWSGFEWEQEVEGARGEHTRDINK